MALNGFLDEAVQSGVPGISVSIADKNGLIWKGVAGYADLSARIPVKEEDLFGIGSITKTFVAVITLQLVEEGLISLDQTVLDILGSDVAGRISGADKVNIAQLLNHTGGIPSWEDDSAWIKEGRGEKLDVKRLWKPQDTLSYIECTALLNEPGEAYSYANTNHTLIGLIIEKITGNNIIEEIKRRILKPVGIMDIYLEGFQTLPVKRLTQRYHYATSKFKKTAGIEKSFKMVTPELIDVSTSNLSVEWVAGGMVATASDLALYAAAFRTGELLKPESMAFVHEWFPIDEKRKVGHGLFHSTVDEQYNLIGHTGGVLGFSAAMHWLEFHDIVMVILANVGTMHIEKKRPNAVSMAVNPDFIKEVVEYSNKYRV
ncbi:beta-lactamase family protein [bacterium AH-315-K03]|nr:beta-lactamase family protein [bacterium AH-315-K03]